MARYCLSRLIPLSALACAAALTAGPGIAACATDDEIAAFVEALNANAPAKALSAGGTMEDALCSQGKLAAAMAPHMGPVIGYKAGLTSAPAQEAFGVTEPVRGILYENMMLEDGASVPVKFGAVPMVESDLVFVVGDAAIASATTPKEVMAHIASVHPFIELADMTLAKGEVIDAVTITAMGVGPKLGVLGAAIPVEDPALMATALAEMTVTLTDGAGETVVSVPGKAVLGHPANSVLWLMKSGVELKAGDLISLGSFGPLTPSAKMNGGASVRYDGLPGTPTVSVTFTE